MGLLIQWSSSLPWRPQWPKATLQPEGEGHLLTALLVQPSPGLLCHSHHSQPPSSPLKLLSPLFLVCVMRATGEVAGRRAEVSVTIARLRPTEAGWASLPLTSARSHDGATSFGAVGGWPGIIIPQPWPLPRASAIPFPFDRLLSAAVPLKGLWVPPIGGHLRAFPRPCYVDGSL